MLPSLLPCRALILDGLEELGELILLQGMGGHVSLCASCMEGKAGGEGRGGGHPSALGMRLPAVMRGVACSDLAALHCALVLDLVVADVDKDIVEVIALGAAWDRRGDGEGVELRVGEGQRGSRGQGASLAAQPGSSSSRSSSGPERGSRGEGSTM